MHELVVIRNSSFATRHASDVTVIDRATLAAQHQVNLLPTAMQRVPGLLVTSRSMLGYGVSTGAAGGLSLRGLAGGSGQMLVLIDGQPQYNGIYGHPIADSYQTLMAERVEVVRGPASLLYGSGAMGGVVNIVTRAMPHDGVKAQFDLGGGSYGTVQTEGSVQARSGRFSATAAIQYSRSDNHRPRMGFQQYGGFLKMGYDFSPHWRAVVNAQGTHFDASQPGTVTAPLYDADQGVTRGEAAVAAENHYARTRGAVSLYGSYGWHRIDDGTDDPDKPTSRYFRSRDALAGVSAWQGANLFAGNTLTLGIDYHHLYGRAFYTSKATGETIDTANKQSATSHRNEVAAYVDLRQDVARWLTINAGIRLDHHSVSGNEWVPQAGIVVRPTANGQVRAMASKGFRNPSMREMYLYPPSNDELLPERIWNYELSWHHKIRMRSGGNALSYGINIFYIHGDNMIQTQLVGGRPRNVNTGRIENWGVEMEADWRINRRWSLTTNHSLLHMDNPVLAAPTYKGFLSAGYRQSGWTVEATLQYVGGLYTAVGDAEQQQDFCLLGATVSYAVTPHVSLWVRGDNLLAQRYELIAGYPMPRATVMGGVSISL